MGCIAREATVLHHLAAWKIINKTFLYYPLAMSIKDLPGKGKLNQKSFHGGGEVGVMDMFWNHTIIIIIIIIIVFITIIETTYNKQVHLNDIFDQWNQDRLLARIHV